MSRLTSQPVLGFEFRKLWAASAVSNLGDGIGLAAAPLLAAALSRDPALVAGLVFAQRLPWFLFSLLSGALVDRLDRRLVIGSANLFRAFLLALLGGVVLVGWANLPLQVNRSNDLRRASPIAVQAGLRAGGLGGS